MSYLRVSPGSIRVLRNRRIRGALFAAALLSLLLAASATAHGGLKQKHGAAGCIVEADTNEEVCADGKELYGAGSVAISPDDANAYVVSQSSGSLGIFNRDPATGALTQKSGTGGCISEDGTGGACIDGTGLDFAETVTVSPDGANVYVASRISDAVAIFDRNPTTGALTQKFGTAGCISETGSAGACVDGTGLDGASTITVSSDGANAYVASRYSDAVAIFDRNPATGALIQKAGTAGCISEDGTAGACVDGTGLDFAIAVSVSPDGASAYVASQGSDAISIFDRNPATGALTQKAGTAGCISETGSAGACVDGTALDGAGSVSVSPDGSSAYVASQESGALSIFDRNPVTGALTQKPGTAGCISDSGTAGACADGAALVGARSVTVSPDGENAYATALESDAVTIFGRDPATGALTQKVGIAGCISETGSVGDCVNGTALDSAESVTISPDGKNAYVAAAISNSVGIFDRDLPPKTRITKQPKRRINTSKGKVEVEVSFTSGGSTFKCKLDKANFEPCTSPYRVNAKSGGGKGKKHTISIKAAGGDGHYGPTAKVRFRLIRKG